jgi:hypothetical protein
MADFIKEINAEEDIQQTQMDEYIAGQIGARVFEGAYMDYDVPAYDSELVKVVDHEGEDYYPLELEGEISKPVCDKHDEECKGCRKKGCNMDISIDWKATFKGREACDYFEGYELTYYVEKI